MFFIMPAFLWIIGVARASYLVYSYENLYAYIFEKKSSRFASLTSA